MTTIITGNFQQQDDAHHALMELTAAGFTSDQMTTFFVNPPGQHDLFPVGGDEDKSPGTEHAAGGSAAGAAAGGAIGVAVGLATLPVLGPVAPVAGAGVGAYVGSLYGALGKMDDKETPESPVTNEASPRIELRRSSGVLVAVAAPASTQQEAAIRILRASGATEIERTQGTIVGGQWTDFDALTPLQLVGG